MTPSSGNWAKPIPRLILRCQRADLAPTTRGTTIISRMASRTALLGTKSKAACRTGATFIPTPSRYGALGNIGGVINLGFSCHFFLFFFVSLFILLLLFFLVPLIPSSTSLLSDYHGSWLFQISAEGQTAKFVDFQSRLFTQFPRRGS